MNRNALVKCKPSAALGSANPVPGDTLRFQAEAAEPDAASTEGDGKAAPHPGGPGGGLGEPQAALFPAAQRS